MCVVYATMSLKRHSSCQRAYCHKFQLDTEVACQLAVLISSQRLSAESFRKKILILEFNNFVYSVIWHSAAYQEVSCSNMTFFVLENPGFDPHF
jgi:hypothetical protein